MFEYGDHPLPVTSLICEIKKNEVILGFYIFYFLGYPSLRTALCIGGISVKDQVEKVKA